MTQTSVLNPEVRGPQTNWVVRSSDEGLLTGLSAGLAREFKTEPLVLRIVFIATSFAAGLGLLAYVILWTLSRRTPLASVPVAPEVSWKATAGFTLIAVGTALSARSVGAWIGGPTTLPLLLAAVGSAVLWTRSGSSVADDPSKRALALFESSVSPWRVVVGSVMIFAAVIGFVVGNVSVSMAGGVLVTLIAVVGGSILLFGPVLFRLLNANRVANRERIRSNERAEVSAHLHDSVLHTLALIQRSKEASPEVVSLARKQERDLRSWLQGRSSEVTTLQEAVNQMATAVEGDTGIVVDAVVVGDATVTEPMIALLAATKEAAMNAGKHSGASNVSIYVELEEHGLTAFVRDTGHGFDKDLIDSNRRGIRESIEGRMQRNGGTVRIDSNSDGTEVELHVPIEAS